MTNKEYRDLRLRELDALMHVGIQQMQRKRVPEKEKDWWNLMYMLNGIGRSGIYYKEGCIATLKRAIKHLEDFMSEEEFLRTRFEFDNYMAAKKGET